ncbi:nitroreductase family deazaflavin-dependent oxidoreductase [Saccharopolyspora sp. HNM0986]|nr:nitroreductase family deazaflavin-dependent oxidoreductase [Saccharopolyspora sp. HNM0986]
MRNKGRRRPPTGLARWMFRLPIQLYRLGLGRVLGSRFMLLTHTGRVTGRQRQVVVEVVGGGPHEGSYFACSGYGEKSAWYRNVLAQPQVRIQVGDRRMIADAEPLGPQQASEVMARYAARNPRAARALCRFMGFDVDGGDADFRAVGRELPFVRFTPRP